MSSRSGEMHPCAAGCRKDSAPCAVCVCVCSRQDPVPSAQVKKDAEGIIPKLFCSNMRNG